MNAWNKFLQALSQDVSAQESLKKTTDRDSFLKAAVELGKSKGYSYTMDELSAQLSQVLSPLFSSLNDDQLGLVVGGANQNALDHRAKSDEELFAQTNGHIGTVALSATACYTSNPYCRSF
jgi:DNA-binding IclR family transcriptional regulator